MIISKISLEKFSNFVIFQTATGKVNIDVLFEKGRTTITEHLKNIYNE